VKDAPFDILQFNGTKWLPIGIHESSKLTMSPNKMIWKTDDLIPVSSKCPYPLLY
jgi:hypothetical protein